MIGEPLEECALAAASMLSAVKLGRGSLLKSEDDLIAQKAWSVPSSDAGAAM